MALIHRATWGGRQGRILVPRKREAHGADEAPVIRFHDDRGGTSRRVHIGFMGPGGQLPLDSAATLS